MADQASSRAASTIGNDPALQASNPSAGGGAPPPMERSVLNLNLFGIKPQGTGQKYYSAGGGEVVVEGTPSGYIRDLFNFFKEEGSRPSDGYTMVIGPDAHSRPPQWMEDKNVAIDGTTLTDSQLRATPGHWMNKYRKELDIGEAVAEVKRQKRQEMEHDVLGSLGWLRRKLGYAAPLDEDHAKINVEARYRIQEDIEKVMAEEKAQQQHSAAGAHAPQTTTTTASSSPSSSPPSSGSGLLFDDEAIDSVMSEQKKRTLGTAWKVLMESVETGKPLAKVAKEYRPQVDFYGIDPFLDSAPSLIWFSTKCGIAIGLFQGTVRAMQAINVDVQFLKASGVGVLSILNMSVFASVVKWGGNTAVFATAFCVGDRLATALKRRVLPPHDAGQRSTSNYVAGLSLSGATVGVLPWWVLNDVTLAARLAASGVVVGGLLGIAVGMTMQRLIALNLSRLDATNRQLRRYEALMQREREWADAERAKHRATNAVWW